MHIFSYDEVERVESCDVRNSFGTVMKNADVTFAGPAPVVGTRGMLGRGLALLFADKLLKDHNEYESRRGRCRMMKVLTVLVFIGPLLLAFPAPARERANVEKGEQLYDEYCSSCHGNAGAGQDRERPRGGRDKDDNRIAPALDGTGHAFHHPPSVLFRITKGGSPDGSGSMPSFGDRLSDRDIRSIIAYFQSLWPDKIMRQYRKEFSREMQ